MWRNNCVKSGLRSDIPFELIFRRESRGSFYFLIQYDKGERAAGETAWMGWETAQA